MSFTAVISQVCEEKLGGVKLKKDQSLAVESAETKGCVGGFTNRIRKEFNFSRVCRGRGVLHKRNVSVLVVCHFLVFSRIRYWRQIRRLKWLEKTAS